MIVLWVGLVWLQAGRINIDQQRIVRTVQCEIGDAPHPELFNGSRLAW